MTSASAAAIPTLDEMGVTKIHAVGHFSTYRICGTEHSSPPLPIPSNPGKVLPHAFARQGKMGSVSHSLDELFPCQSQSLRNKREMVNNSDEQGGNQEARI